MIEKRLAPERVEEFLCRVALKCLEHEVLDDENHRKLLWDLVKVHSQSEIPEHVPGPKGWISEVRFMPFGASVPAFPRRRKASES